MDKAIFPKHVAVVGAADADEDFTGGGEKIRPLLERDAGRLGGAAGTRLGPKPLMELFSADFILKPSAGGMIMPLEGDRDDEA